jgi:hypothetical protein
MVRWCLAHHADAIMDCRRSPAAAWPWRMVGFDSDCRFGH